MFFPLESIISFKLDTVLEHATLFPGGLYSSAFGFFMNEDKWNKLSKQDQDAIETVSGEHARAPRRQVLGRGRPAGHGGAEEGRRQDRQRQPRASWPRCKKRSAPIIEDWVKQASAKGVDGAKVLAEFREELKKVAAGNE